MELWFPVLLGLLGLLTKLEALISLSLVRSIIIPAIDKIILRLSDIPVPGIQSVNQVSQHEVEVSTSVADTQCVAIYVVNTIRNNSNGRSSATSPVTVDGIDLCRYSYSFVGYVITPGNITGDVSAPFSFTATLSGM